MPPASSRRPAATRGGGKAEGVGRLLLAGEPLLRRDKPAGGMPANLRSCRKSRLSSTRPAGSTDSVTATVRCGASSASRALRGGLQVALPMAWRRPTAIARGAGVMELWSPGTLALLRGFRRFHKEVTEKTERKPCRGCDKAVRLRSLRYLFVVMGCGSAALGNPWSRNPNPGTEPRMTRRPRMPEEDETPGTRVRPPPPPEYRAQTRLTWRATPGACGGRTRVLHFCIARPRRPCAAGAQFACYARTAHPLLSSSAPPTAGRRKTIGGPGWASRRGTIAGHDPSARQALVSRIVAGLDVDEGAVGENLGVWSGEELEAVAAQARPLRGIVAVVDEGDCRVRRR